MKVGCGVIMVFIAVCLIWVTATNIQSAQTANGLERLVGADKRSADSAVTFGIGALLFGIVGIIFMATRRSAPVQPPPPEAPRPEPVPQAAPPAAASPGDSRVEKRLLDLKGLLDKQLISEEEYTARRTEILAHL